MIHARSSLPPKQSPKIYIIRRTSWRVLRFRTITNMFAVVENKDMHHGSVHNGQVADV